MKLSSMVVLPVLGIIASLHLTGRALACGDYESLSLNRWAREAVSSDPQVSAAAIASLRAAGPTGLETMFKVHNQQIALRAAPNVVRINGEENDDWARLKAALEGVSGQRDCEASRLFWFTDFDMAKAAAVASGKPILSLRLLGKLNDEYSCANSRFFRTTLYANTEVSAYLRQNFVLHWKSVRPVPRITVDFGDGRKIERTITGNSIHYVLDSRGDIVDALPGLYGARAFLSGLKKAETAAKDSGSLDNQNRATLLSEYHNLGFGNLESAWARDLQLIRTGQGQISISRLTTPVSLVAGPPPAEIAGRVTASKGAVEKPLLKSRRPGARLDLDSERLDSRLDDETWAKIAALHAEDAALDQGSRSLIRSKSPAATLAALVADGKRRVEDPLLRSLRNLERSISEDTVRNEYLLHTRIHQWLAQETSPDLDKFNARVYAELFLTPDSDPWLGLVPADTYSALDNDGLVTQVNKLSARSTN